MSIPQSLAIAPPRFQRIDLRPFYLFGLPVVLSAAAPADQISLDDVARWFDVPRHLIESRLNTFAGYVRRPLERVATSSQQENSMILVQICLRVRGTPTILSREVVLPAIPRVGDQVEMFDGAAAVSVTDVVWLLDAADADRPNVVKVMSGLAQPSEVASLVEAGWKVAP